MTDKPDNVMAFPNQGWVGMTLRDYFAAKAMAAILEHEDAMGDSFGVIAHVSYEMADAMLIERAKPCT